MALLKIGLATWPAIDDYLRTADPTVLVSISPVEEHGPHLPTGTDYLLTEKVTEAVAEHFGCAVFPTIPLMCCGVSANTTGTYAIRSCGLEEITGNLATQFARKGFKFVYYITAHHGFSVQVMRRKITELTLNGCVVEVIPLKEVTIIPPGIGQPDRHAGWVETASMMALYPELVTYPLPPADYHRDEGGDLVLSGSGIDGDPRVASAEKGKIIFDAAVAGVIRRIESRVAAAA